VDYNYQTLIPVRIKLTLVRDNCCKCEFLGLLFLANQIHLNQ
jgi:hypothetical protein